MTPETFAIAILAGCILVAQWLLLQRFTEVSGVLKECQPHFSDITTNFSDVGDGINESLMEMIRIGSDVADQIDNLSSGVGVVSTPALSPQVDLQTTIMSLIADKFLGSIHGDPKEQIRPIQQENDTPPESISSE